MANEDLPPSLRTQDDLPPSMRSSATAPDDLPPSLRKAPDGPPSLRTPTQLKTETTPKIPLDTGKLSGEALEMGAGRSYPSSGVTTLSPSIDVAFTAQAAMHPVQTAKAIGALAKLGYDVATHPVETAKAVGAAIKSLHKLFSKTGDIVESEVPNLAKQAGVGEKLALPAGPKSVEGPAPISAAFRYPDGRIEPTSSHGSWKVMQPGRESGYVDARGKFITNQDVQGMIEKGTFPEKPFTSEFKMKEPVVSQAPGTSVPIEQEKGFAIKGTPTPKVTSNPPKINDLSSTEGRLADIQAKVDKGLITEPKIPSILRPLTTRQSLEDKAEQGFGPLHRQHDAILKSVNDAEAQAQKDLTKVMSYGVKKGSKESKLAFQLGDGKITPEDVKTAAPQQAQKIEKTVEEGRKQYTAYINAINEQRAARGLRPINVRKDYVTHYEETRLLDDAKELLTVDDPAKLAQEGAKQLAAERAAGALPKEYDDVVFQHVKRKGGETGEDYIEAFDRYSRHANRVLHVQPMVDELHKTAEVLAPKAPNLAAYIEGQANQLAGGVHPLDKAIIHTIGRKTYSAATGFGRGFINGALNLNPMVIVEHFRNLAESFGENRFNMASSLFTGNFSPEARRFALANSEELRSTALRASREWLNSKFQATTHVPISQFFTETGINAFNAAYKEAVPKVGHDAAVRIANAQVRRILGATNEANTPPMLRSQAAKVLIPFQNMATSFSNYLWYGLWRDGFSPETVKRAVSFTTAYLGAISAIAAIKGTGALGATWNVLKDSVPFVGPMTAVGGPFRGVQTVAGDVYRKNAAKAFQDAFESAFVAGLIPGTSEIPGRGEMVKIVKGRIF